MASKTRDFSKLIIALNPNLHPSVFREFSSLKCTAEPCLWSLGWRVADDWLVIRDNFSIKQMAVLHSLISTSAGRPAEKLSVVRGILKVGWHVFRADGPSPT
jgi:hypothetical protein